MDNNGLTTGQPTVGHSQTVKSSIVKAGKRTYFFDLKVSAGQTKFLKVTESSFVPGTDQRKYNSFLIFADAIADFQKSLTEIAKELA